MSTIENHPTRRQIRRVLIITLILNVVVAVSKIVIGVISGALSITADGFHSLVDGSSNVVALVANRIADRPPDADHPYGHRRFETIAALAIGAFLLVTAWEIISNAITRLSGHGEKPDITPLTFMVMVGTLVVNLFVTWYEGHEGKRLRSELLTADAAHTRTDVYVTISVITSLILVQALGWAWLDTAAALVIVALILRAAWQVVRRTGSVLVDTAPYPPEQLKAWAEELPSVERVVRARSRGPADAAHIDIDVEVAPETTADRAAAIADAIRDRLQQELDGVSEVEVHFEPVENGQKDFALAARASADALGLATHEVHTRPGERGMVLELHVEVPPDDTLGAAHERVSRLEQEIQARLPDVREVVTHIEPALDHIGVPVEPSDPAGEELRQRALSLLKERFPDADWHHLRANRLNGSFALSLHVGLPGQISVEAAHRVAEAAEIMLRAELPDLDRVTIHTEPPEPR